MTALRPGLDLMFQDRPGHCDLGIATVGPFVVHLETLPEPFVAHGHLQPEEFGDWRHLGVLLAMY